MHTYSIDRDLRTKVAVSIFILSMFISWILNYCFSDCIGNIVGYLENSKIKNAVQLLQWLEVNPTMVLLMTMQS